MAGTLLFPFLLRHRLLCPLAAFRSVRWCSLPEQPAFHGISWHRDAKKWSAKIYQGSTCFFLGLFSDRNTAALAHDAALRQHGLAESKLHRLNFPTLHEKAQMKLDRSRLRPPLSSMVIEAESKAVIEAYISSGWELQWLGEGTRADGVFRDASACGLDAWVGIQVKAARLSARRRCYSFSRTSGYNGFLVLAVPIGEDFCWAFPGSAVTASMLCVTVGGKWDAFRVRLDDLPNLFHSCWADPVEYPRSPLTIWRQQCSSGQRLEESACDQLSRLFQRAGLKVVPPSVGMGPVDMVIEDSIRVQCKARQCSYLPTQRYDVSLHRRDASSHRQYDEEEFDVLIVQLMRERALDGFFVFPATLLHQHKLVGQSRKSGGLCVFPPWARPGTARTRAAMAWQAPCFFPACHSLLEVDLQRLRGILKTRGVCCSISTP